MPTHRPRYVFADTAPPLHHALMMSPHCILKGQLTDLTMSIRSWRDVRPYHLAGCQCALCAHTPSSSPSPMSSFAGSCSLMPASAAELSSDYYHADIPASTFGFR